MSKQSSAQLLRYSLPPEKLPDGLEVWTLDFYPRDELYSVVKDIESRLRTSGSDVDITIPYRQLNRLISAVCPTLAHGFEVFKHGKQSFQQALAVGTPSTPAQCPKPDDLRFVIRRWLEWWLETSDTLKKLPSHELESYGQKLLNVVDHPPEGWGWQRREVSTLLSPFDASLGLNYQAIPSVLAALLHDKTSRVRGKTIRWRKVQEGKKLAVIGFGPDGPAATSHNIDEFRKRKQGEGHFAYKLEIELETQAGREEPWIFLSLHVQRYAEAKVIRDNGRSTSVLVAAHRARLDNFPTDTTLVRLTSKSRKGGTRYWKDDVDELLRRVAVTHGLKDPTDIFSAPQDYWASGAEQGEYYVVHAEGYQYEGQGRGHPLEAGPSMTEIREVLDAILDEHLPMLVPDKPLGVDPRISGLKTPAAMRNFEWMNEKDTSKEATGEKRFSRKVPGGMEEVLKRALRGEPVHLSLFYYYEETLEGMKLALNKAFFTESGDHPPNLVVTCHPIKHELLRGFEKSRDGNIPKFHNARRREWREFLKEIPKQGEHFAIVELLKGEWLVKGAVRAACAQEDISLQGVMTIRTKRDDSGKTIFVQGGHEHRANSAMRDITLRHTGALYGNPQEIYGAAGIGEEIEVVAFHLENKRQRNLFFPLATKLSADGAVDAFLPGQAGWLPYHEAAHVLGRSFEKEWKNIRFNWDKKQRQISYKKRGESYLYHDAKELVSFVKEVLKSLSKPTIVLVNAKNWRSKHHKEEVWSQLRNPDLPEHWNDLTLGGKTCQRDEDGLENILAVVRLRSDDETPQYLTDNLHSPTQPIGLIEAAPGQLMHFFSIGQGLVTAKGQESRKHYDAVMSDQKGSGIAFKYPQVVEMVPFFVRDDYKSEEGLKQLCRVAHYLRVSPAWSQGNIVEPYPLHLAEALVQDQLCILNMDD